jgi:hypothetical protein
MSRFLAVYARLVASLGTILLAAALLVDTRWLQQPVGVAGIILIALGLRAFQISLTKYSALNLLGMAAAGGAIIIGAPATALGLYVGVFVADWLLLRKAPAASAINGGREALALFGPSGSTPGSPRWARAEPLAPSVPMRSRPLCCCWWRIFCSAADSSTARS